MNIGICCYPSYGGSGVVATELGLKLAERGHQIHFISYDKPFRLGEYHANVYYHGVDVPNYPVFKHPPYIMALSNRLYEIAKRERLDILHAHYATPHGLAVYLAKEMLGGKIKTVTTLHGTDVTIMGEEPTLQDISEFSLLKADAVTAVSEDLKIQAQGIFGNKLEIERIYNFVDTQEYIRRPVACVKDCLKLDDEKVIVHISNFRKVKRIDDVIKIFHKVQQEVKCRLVLVGDGPEQRHAYELSEQLGISHLIHYLGKQNNVISILSCADVFLLPSEKESFGLAALEAMACGVPVVATRVGGLPELIVEGESGYLSEIGDVEHMSANILELLKNESHHQLMAANARKQAINLFDSEIVIPQYEALYERLLGE